MNSDEQEENKLKGFEDTSMIKTRKARLCKHRFFLDDEKYSYGYGRGIQVVVAFLVGLSLILVIGGLFLPSLKLQFAGVVGILIGFIDPASSEIVVSSIDIVPLVAEGADPDTKTQMGILFLQLVYIIFIAITPMLLMALYVTIFFAKLTLKEQKTLLVAAEIVFAWEALIILVVSYLGAVFQISQLASFIANSATNDFCNFAEDQLLSLGFDSSDAKCLDVIASIVPSGYIIVLGTFIFVFTSIIMFRLTHTAIEDREWLNKYKIARKAGNQEQMEQLKRKAHHPLKHKGFILGPLIRAACMKYRRRGRNNRGGSYEETNTVFTAANGGVGAGAPPPQTTTTTGIFGSKKESESSQVSNPMFPVGTTPFPDDDDDIEV